MDIDPQDKQLPDLLMYLLARERHFPRDGNFLRKMLRGCDSRSEQLFKEGRLDRLGQCVRDGEFGHVILLIAEGDEVVVDAGLVLGRVVEVEILGLDVPRGEFLALEAGERGEEGGLLRGSHTPEDNRAVGEEEDFGDVDGGVEVGGVGEIGLGMCLVC